MHVRPTLFMGTLPTSKSDLCYHKSLKCAISTPSDTVNVMLRNVLPYPAGSQAQSEPSFRPWCGDDPEHEICPAVQGPQFLKLQIYLLAKHVA